MYTGTFLSAETLQRVGPPVSKEFWVRGAQLLMEEIFRGGCADSLSQSLAVVLMGLGPPDVSQYGGTTVSLHCSVLEACHGLHGPHLQAGDLGEGGRGG